MCEPQTIQMCTEALEVAINTRGPLPVQVSSETLEVALNATESLPIQIGNQALEAAIDSGVIQLTLQPGTVDYVNMWFIIANVVFSVFITGLLVYIASKQYRVDKNRLNYEKFGKRLPMLEAITPYINEVKGLGKSSDYLPIRYRFEDTTEMAAYVFDEKIAKYLERLLEITNEFSNVIAEKEQADSRQGSMGQAEYDECVATYAREKAELTRNLNDFEKTIHPTFKDYF